MRRPGLRRSTTLLAALVAWPALGEEVGAQVWYAGPEAGWSEVRGITVGARGGAELVGGLDAVVQGLLHFPDEREVVDPGTAASRSSWQASLNVHYVFDRSRAFAPYVGVGLRYGRATLTLVSEGYRASRVTAGFGHNLLGGVQLPRLPWHPWIEVRSGSGLTTVTAGLQWRPGGGQPGGP